MNRGDIFRVRPAASRSGHEQQGARFAVIVQTDNLLRLSTVIVAPTSRSAGPASFRPVIQIDGHQTRVMIDQLTAVDVQRLGDGRGRVAIEEQWAIDDALRTMLAIA